MGLDIMQERKESKKNKKNKNKKMKASTEDATSKIEAVAPDVVVEASPRKEKRKRSEEQAAAPETDDNTTIASDDATIKKKKKSKKEKKDKKQKKQKKEEKEQTEEKSKSKKQKTNKADEKVDASPSKAAASSSANPKDTNAVVTVDGVDDSFKPVKSFSESNFPKDLLNAVCEGFTAPTPIQANAWPILRAKRDIVGIACTGSGKTLAFLLPVLENIKGYHKSASKKGPFALILAPTRELACQIRDVAVGAVKCGIRTVCLYGGVSKGEQKAEIRKGVDIIVATPGRLLDLINEAAVDVSLVSYLVLDEADRMLDMGFERDIRAIIGRTPSGDKRQTLMFSATWPTEIQQLASEFLRNPAKVTIGSPELSANVSVKQIVEVMDPKFKQRKLEDLLSKYHRDNNRIIIFALYKKEAARLESLLWNKGWNVAAIHGDMSQIQRTNAINSFKDGSVPLLVATDVAARGLDIPDVEYVINVTFPLTVEDYVHRIGRTGRAGRTGVAHTFFTIMERHLSAELVGVLEGAKQPVPEELVKMSRSAPQRVQKKKEHSFYGAHFRPEDEKDIAFQSQKPTHVRFDD